MSERVAPLPSEAPEVKRARVQVGGVVAVCITALLLAHAVPEPFVPAMLASLTLIGGIETWSRLARRK